jgi:site-specific DNA-methyltransferase (adenine-specific)
MATFIKGDCLVEIKKLKDNSIDFIYFNPPFGTTKQWWDEKLNWKELFIEMFRVLTNTGSIAIHCSVPFNYTLIQAAPKPPTYTWYWNKLGTTNPLIAKKQPLRHIEEILIWNKKTVKYNPQRVGNEIRYAHADGRSDYVDPLKNASSVKKQVIGKYQTHYIECKRKIDGFSTRPDSLIELFIKSYTNENDKVLDMTCYKGLSGVICRKLNRKWIGFDKYFFPELLMRNDILVPSPPKN